MLEPMMRDLPRKGQVHRMRCPSGGPHHRFFRQRRVARRRGTTSFRLMLALSAGVGSSLRASYPPITVDCH
jgi:hypothetical protein